VLINVRICDAWRPTSRPPTRFGRYAARLRRVNPRADRSPLHKPVKTHPNSPIIDTPPSLIPRHQTARVGGRVSTDK